MTTTYRRDGKGGWIKETIDISIRLEKNEEEKKNTRKEQRERNARIEEERNSLLSWKVENGISEDIKLSTDDRIRYNMYCNLITAANSRPAPRRSYCPHCGGVMPCQDEDCRQH